MIVYIIIIAVLLILVWIFITYNKLIKDRNHISEAWSGIDVQLKRRHDLIPNLADAVKGYSLHEKKLLEDITEKRAKSTNTNVLSEKAIAESDISGIFRNLIVLAENYPDLKASTNFLEFQKQLVEVEDHLQYARRYFNGTVRDYNIRVESFPGNIVAGIFNFKPKGFFEITLATEKQTPQVEL